MSDKLASQVAAGEVVERPESVVRELVDNAIDAGARHIEIRVEKGGVALITVGDDGMGMAHDDALLSLERHATSKLSSIEDLQSLQTLGFRGEALPSIASVSRLRLHTRQPGALSGTLVAVEGGIIREAREEGCPPGTLVEVRQLFYNVPARRKFLRTEATEFAHIDQRIRLMAAGHPTIGFALFHNNREIFRIASGQSRLTRIRELLGADVADKLLTVKGDALGEQVAGLTSRPGFSRPTRSMMLFFVNGRPVESPILRAVVTDTYGNLIEKGTYPACVLFLDLDPATFDVNVHPAKREIRFRQPQIVQNLVRSALATALQPPIFPPTSGISPAGGGIIPPPSIPAATAHTPTSQPEPADPSTWEPTSPPVVTPDMPGLILPPPVTATVAPAANLNSAVYLGTVLEAYEVFAMDDGLLLMERRAAVERILFEWLAEHRGQETASQSLLLPITLVLAPQEWEAVEPHLGALRAIGIGVEPFGPRTLLLTALPAPIRSDDPGTLAKLILGAIQTASQNKRGPLERRTLLAVVSRELAGAGRSLPECGTGPELLQRLLGCEMPYCCPRGRATLSQLSRQDLARRFGLL